MSHFEASGSKFMISGAFLTLAQSAMSNTEMAIILGTVAVNRYIE
jgi:hypothetical protein